MKEKFYNYGKDVKYKFVISNMLKNNYSINEICNITGLSLEDINMYKKDLDDVMSLDEHRKLRYDICYRDGYYKKEKQIAINMLEDNYDIELISNITGLSIKILEDMKEF